MAAITNKWRIPANPSNDRTRNSVNALVDGMFNQGGRSMPGLTLPALTMSGGQILLADSVSGVPSLSFASDNDNGIRYQGPNEWQTIAGGQIVSDLRYNGTVTQALFGNGVVTAPSIGFFGDASVDSGLYRVGENDIGMAAGGVIAGEWRNLGGVTQTLIPLGTVAVPGVGFMTGTGDTGLYSPAVHVGAMVTNGAQIATWQQLANTAPAFGVGIVPTFPFHVSVSNAGAFVGTIQQLDNGSTSHGLYVTSAATNVNSTVFYVETAAAARFQVGGDGSVVVGSGTRMGAGTLNVQTNVYKAGTAYTNPAYALEHWATGQIVVHADKEGARGYRRSTLDEAERYIRRHYELPGHLPSFGMFDGGDWLLEKLEEAWIHIIELHHRIEALEA